MDTTWLVRGVQGQQEATIYINTTMGHRGNFCFSFDCKRLVKHRDPRIDTVFVNAVKGNARLDMTPPDGEICGAQEIGHCGNRRGALAECRCAVLNRIDQPQLRHGYETRMINEIFDVLAKQNKSSFHLKLGMFSTGHLLGEEILVFRLLNRLKREGYQGTLELFLIDEEYEQPIARSQHGTTFENSMGGADYIVQFLTELSYCAPTTINITGTFFASAQDYMAMGDYNPNFKHHLLIGADVGDKRATADMGQVAVRSAIRPQPATALIKMEQLTTGRVDPLVCRIDPRGQPVRCVNPVPTQTVVRQHQNQGVPGWVKALGVTATAVGGIYYFATRNNRGNNSVAGNR